MEELKNTQPVEPLINVVYTDEIQEIERHGYDHTGNWYRYSGFPNTIFDMHFFNANFKSEGMMPVEILRRVSYGPAPVAPENAIYGITPDREAGEVTYQFANGLVLQIIYIGERNFIEYFHGDKNSDLAKIIDDQIKVGNVVSLNSPYVAMRIAAERIKYLRQCLQQYGDLSDSHESAAIGVIKPDAESLVHSDKAIVSLGTRQVLDSLGNMGEILSYGIPTGQLEFPPVPKVTFDEVIDNPDTGFQGAKLHSPPLKPVVYSRYTGYIGTGHIGRLIERGRSNEENEFGVSLEEYSDWLQKYIEAQPPEYQAKVIDIINTEGFDTTMWWTFAPYVYKELETVKVYGPLAMVRLIDWALTGNNDDRNRDDFDQIHLKGLEFMNGHGVSTNKLNYILHEHPGHITHLFTRQEAKRLVKEGIFGEPPIYHVDDED